MTAAVAGVAEPEDDVYGSTTPRVWTRPLVTGPPGPCGCGCALTPDTSLGFEAVAFAIEVLGETLLPWQRWWLIHALELRRTKRTVRFRFRTILTLIARQQGKTWLVKVLSLWAMYLGGVKLVLGSAQTLDIADEAWRGAVDMIENTPDLADELAGVIRGNGKTCITLTNGARYRTVAATEGAGRGLSVGLLVLDELRQHKTWAAWGALTKTTIAQVNALIVAITNAGSDESVVLNSLHDTALAENDQSVGLFEWSAPPGCELDDVDAIAQACPALGYGRVSLPGIATARATDPPGVYRTEILCQRVSGLDMAIDAAAWKACEDRDGSLGPVRDRVALCLDVSPDRLHATLTAAAVLDDGRVRIEVIAAWNDVDAVRTDLPVLVEQIKPADIGWFPMSPAAELGAEMRTLRRFIRRRIARIATVDGVRKLIDTDEEEATRLAGQMDREACAGYAGLVRSRRLLHDGSALLTAHSLAAAWDPHGRFARLDTGHIDAAYSAAGAVYLARMLPPAAKVGKARVY
jgi:hypothetical protein